MAILKKIADSTCGSSIQDKAPDKYTLFGKFVAESLKELDDTSRHIVQHRISSIIFEAQMGVLSARPQAALQTVLVTVHNIVYKSNQLVMYSFGFI